VYFQVSTLKIVCLRVKMTLISLSVGKDTLSVILILFSVIQFRHSKTSFSTLHKIKGVSFLHLSRLALETTLAEALFLCLNGGRNNTPDFTVCITISPRINSLYKISRGPYSRRSYPRRHSRRPYKHLAKNTFSRVT
jgi:hypothetical protein